MSSNNPVAEPQAIKRDKNVPNVDDGAKAPSPAIKRMDISALQIDEASFVDCDPYNSTGQFVADKIKEQFRD